MSIVWVGLDGDEIVAGHLPEHCKVHNVRNDSRVALSIETGKRNAMGLNEYLVIYGTARITEGGAAEYRTGWRCRSCSAGAPGVFGMGLLIHPARDVAYAQMADGQSG